MNTFMGIDKAVNLDSQTAVAVVQRYPTNGFKLKLLVVFEKKDGKWWARLVASDGRCVATTACRRSQSNLASAVAKAILDIEAVDFFASKDYKGSAECVWLFHTNRLWQWRFPRKKSVLFSACKFDNIRKAWSDARRFQNFIVELT